MAVVAVAAIAITVYHPNLFLFLIAVFSFHLSLYGYRSIQRRRAADVQKSRLIDLCVACIASLCYATFIAWGIFVFFTSNNQAFGYISIEFGIIGMRLSAREFTAYQTPSADKMQWWFDHMQGMLGSYIATLSAFSAVNFYFLPDILHWLWPTLIGTPLLFFWERYYKRKFSGDGSQILKSKRLELNAESER